MRISRVQSGHSTNIDLHRPPRGFRTTSFLAWGKLTSLYIVDWILELEVSNSDSRLCKLLTDPIRDILADSLTCSSRLPSTQGEAVHFIVLRIDDEDEDFRERELS